VREVDLSWVEAPCWAIPVWASLDGAADQTDPLVTAITRLVTVGIDRDAGIAAHLGMPRSLVQAAANLLVSSGALVRDEDGRLAPPAEPSREDEDAERRVHPAWILWDPLHNRPVLQLVLSDQPPGSRLWVEGRPPPMRLVEEALRLLPLVPDLRVLEPRGEHGGHLLDAARVTGLRLRGDGRACRASGQIAVEQRVSGAVVWRLSAVRDREDPGELDPRGWEGLLERPDVDTEPVRADRDAFQSKRLQPILDELGFKTLDELREAARREVSRELTGISRARGWGRTLKAIEDAAIDQRMAMAIDAGWRRLARGWAEAIEALTLEAIAHARQVIAGMEAPPSLPPEVAGRIERLAGPSWSLVVRCSTNKRDFKELKRKLERGEDSAGHRLITLAMAAGADREVRRALEEADARVRSEFPGAGGLFKLLDDARAERNAISHVRTREEDIDVSALRQRVLVLARVLMASGLGR
jgi:hypothetical protein